MKKITVCTGKEELQLLPHQIPGFLASLDAKKTKIALKAKKQTRHGMGFVTINAPPLTPENFIETYKDIKKRGMQDLCVIAVRKSLWTRLVEYWESIQ